jgi:Tfp pilus assembly protein PilV
MNTGSIVVLVIVIVVLGLAAFLVRVYNTFAATREDIRAAQAAQNVARDRKRAVQRHVRRCTRHATKHNLNVVRSATRRGRP